MRQSAAQLLSEFVDRETELDIFLDMIDSEDTSVFVVWGDGGVGKSLFMAKLIHEVSSRSLNKSEVYWSETRNHDYLGVMRKIRDDIGPKHFTSFTDLVNYFTVPQYELKVSLSDVISINVGEQAKIESSEIGDIAGIIIKDVMLTDPRSDMGVSESERMVRLTDEFLKCLAKALGDKQLVVFLDAVEKLSSETEAWLWEELLAAGSDGRIKAIKFVLCSRNEPELGSGWNRVTEIAELLPLGRDHIRLYLERRGVTEGLDELADMLVGTSGGNMALLSTQVDSFLKLRQRREQVRD